jgi:hypothetical protein
MYVLLRIMIAIIILILSLSITFFNIDLIIKIIFEQIDFFFYGIIGLLIFFQFFKQTSKTVEWFEVFTHELTHAIFAILTFNKVRNFNASSTGNGSVEYQGKRNWIITLSPYCIPIYTVVLCLLYPFFLREYWNVLDFLVGFSFVFHLRTFWKQLNPNQPDIKVYGFTFSYLFISALNIYFLFTIPLLVSKGGLFLLWWEPLSNSINCLLSIR